MKRKIKARWLAALRSGEYSQAQGMLGIRPNGPDSPAFYCCLGVLCEVVGKAAKAPRLESLDASERWRIGWDDERSVLPPKVAKYVGLDLGNPELPIERRDGDSGFVTLSFLNDEGLTFPQIADIIEHFL